MKYIGFSCLNSLFKTHFRINRNVIQPMEENPCEGQKMGKWKNILMGIAEESSLYEVETELHRNEDEYFNYLASCPKDSWPIIIKRYISEITPCYNAARFETLIHEGSQKEKDALQICALALTMVIDLIEDFCPKEKKDLEKNLPKRFIQDSEDNSIQSEYEQALFKKPTFVRFMRLIIEEGFITEDGEWIFLQEEKPSAASFYGSLAYFAKKTLVSYGIIIDMNDNGFKWEKCRSLFPDLKNKENSYLSDKLERFRNNPPNSQKANKKKIDSFFETYKRKIEVTPSFCGVL